MMFIHCQGDCRVTSGHLLNHLKGQHPLIVMEIQVRKDIAQQKCQGKLLSQSLLILSPGLAILAVH